MFRFCWKIIWWLFRVAVLVWFLLLPVIPVYGWLSPWPAAEQKLDAAGVRGIKLMIGAGGGSVNENGRWREERQRSYIVLPLSFRTMQIFTYQEARGSEITGVERELLRSRWLIPLFLLWIAAGWFSFRTVKVYITRARTNQQP
jgi:hypothetical protein